VTEPQEVPSAQERRLLQVDLHPNVDTESLQFYRLHVSPDGIKLGANSLHIHEAVRRLFVKKNEDSGEIVIRGFNGSGELMQKTTVLPPGVTGYISTTYPGALTRLRGQ